MYNKYIKLALQNVNLIKEDQIRNQLSLTSNILSNLLFSNKFKSEYSILNLLKEMTILIEFKTIPLGVEQYFAYSMRNNIDIRLKINILMSFLISGNCV